MYKLNIFDNIKLPINWYIIYYGIKKGFFDIQVAKDYAIRIIEINDDVSQEELELAWGEGDKLEILKKIETIPHIQIATEENMELAKNVIRVAILSHIRNSEKCIDELFKKVDMLYADFNYPVDMDSFISYMPVKNDDMRNMHTKEENEIRLVNKIDSFIKEQIEKYQ